MRRGLGVGAVALAGVVAAGTAGVAAPKCARPAEVTAIQAAAVQQQLMVAALTCSDVASFNAFQTNFSKELRSADRHLQSMFQRFYGWREGAGEYNAFKTRLANDSSIRSIHDNAGYCHEAQLVFEAALAPEKPALADFVSSVAVHEDNPVDSCQMRVAAGLKDAPAMPSVVPTPNPLRVAMLTPAPAVATAHAADQPPATGPAAAQAAVAPAAPVVGSSSAAAAPVASAAPAQSGAAKPAEEPKKHAGWLSNIFN